MATIVTKVYGTGATLSQNQEPEAKQEVSLNYGRLRYISDEYVVPAADELGVGATINLFEMPAGARVIDMMLTQPGSLGVGATSNIGWDASVALDDVGVVLEAANLSGAYSAIDLNAADARTKAAATAAIFRKKFAAKVQMSMNTFNQATVGAGGITILLEAFIVVD